MSVAGLSLIGALGAQALGYRQMADAALMLAGLVSAGLFLIGLLWALTWAIDHLTRFLAWLLWR